MVVDGSGISRDILTSEDHGTEFVTGKADGLLTRVQTAAAAADAGVLVDVQRVIERKDRFQTIAQRFRTLENPKQYGGHIDAVIADYNRRAARSADQRAGDQAYSRLAPGNRPRSVTAIRRRHALRRRRGAAEPEEP